MHPNDILYVLAFVLVNPLASAAPIFPNSNDIDENGYFLPGAAGIRPVPGFTGPKDRRDIIGTLEGVANGAVNDVEGFVNSIFKERALDTSTLPRRDIVGTLEGVANGAINDVEGVFNSIFKERDLKGDLNSAIDDANQAIDNIAGDVDPSFNPPDIPNLPKRDIVGTLEGVANGAINDVEGVFNSIFRKRDGADSLHLTLDEIRRMQAADDEMSKRAVDRRDIIGTLEGLVNGGVNDVEGVVNGLFSKRDIVGTLEGVANGAINDVEGVFNSIFKERDLVGDLNGAIDSANQAIGTIAGDVDSNFNPPDIPNIPTKRDLVGDLNGAIDSANQAIGTIAGDVDPNLNPPDIPNIPSKRFVCEELDGCDGPLFPGDFPGGVGPVIEEKVQAS